MQGDEIGMAATCPSSPTGIPPDNIMSLIILPLNSCKKLLAQLGYIWYTLVFTNYDMRQS